MLVSSAGAGSNPACGRTGCLSAGQIPSGNGAFADVLDWTPRDIWWQGDCRTAVPACLPPETAGPTRVRQLTTAAADGSTAALARCWSCERRRVIFGIYRAGWEACAPRRAFSHAAAFCFAGANFAGFGPDKPGDPM